MTNVTQLRLVEVVRLDCERLEELIHEYGDQGAERFLCRALEDIAVRLNKAERAWRRSDMVRLCHGARELSDIAESVGLLTLARVAHDVSDMAISGDQAALAATVSRLSRIGEMSLMSVWEQRDQSV